MVQRPGIGVVLTLALLVASVPVCPCAPGGGETGHACCAPELAISAGHGDCCPPAPELTGAQADGPGLERLAEAGPSPALDPFGSGSHSRVASTSTPSPPTVLRI